MTALSSFARRALAALAVTSLFCLAPAAAQAKTVRAELRVLTPTEVLDPGTSYYVGAESVTSDPDADCFPGGIGGSGAGYQLPEPTAFSLLATGVGATKDLRPLSFTDEFGFGYGICGIGGEVARPAESFWYVKHNHEELTVGAEQQSISRGDEVLFYLALDNFPAPNPAELELLAPARAEQGSRLEVEVREHGCVTDATTFEVSCQTLPAAGATIAGAPGSVTTGADGKASFEAPANSKLELTATRGADIPSARLRVCIGAVLADCPPARGRRLIGSGERDKIKGTRGDDRIRARGGDDRIEIDSGGGDRVDCGPGDDKVTLKERDDDDRIADDCERIRV